MKVKLPNGIIRLLMLLAISLMLTGCISTVVGAVVDTTIAVVKIPFKVGGAIIDVVTPDKLTDSQQSSDRNSSEDDEMELQLESDGL